MPSSTTRSRRPRREQIHHHLDGCVDCLQAFDFHAELKQVIAASASNDEMPPGLLAKIELCFNEDFDGDGIIGRRRLTGAAGARSRDRTEAATVRWRACSPPRSGIGGSV